MELPYLKNKRKNGGAGPPAEIEREPDSTNPDQLLEIIAEEFMSALERKDRAELLNALRAFILNIQDQDEDQDHG